MRPLRTSAQVRLNRRFQPSATPLPTQATEAATAFAFNEEPEQETIADIAEPTVAPKPAGIGFK